MLYIYGPAVNICTRIYTWRWNVRHQSSCGKSASEKKRTHLVKTELGGRVEENNAFSQTKTKHYPLVTERINNKSLLLPTIFPSFGCPSHLKDVSQLQSTKMNARIRIKSTPKSNNLEPRFIYGPMKIDCLMGMPYFQTPKCHTNSAIYPILRHHSAISSQIPSVNALLEISH